ncbi:uncharacterized protein FA14DRAFT_154119 [Meira miltonrushii]|uniref:Uncharacterized protein n=1 Tax=Meira miltonrushii TaxID=1280837 RepID=A0A316VC25_9BASI|nr:uncharacterized protein FA14DRAFT_154119 [Meira miltonrushii]PWN34668.1 hypothetical protein FA14DRAFT_154119 [Meira miltonrushii]
MKVVTAASNTLQYLSIEIWIEDLTVERGILGINLGKLKHLHFSVIGGKRTPCKLKCTNLESLRLKSIDDLRFFSALPSLKTFFFEEAGTFYNDSVCERLTNLAADKLHTLYVYSSQISETTFFGLFSKTGQLQHLQKIVVLANNGWSRMLNHDAFYKFSLSQGVRKIASLTWQGTGSQDFPHPTTQDLIREHFATEFNCIQQQQKGKLSKFSYDIMGDFVEHRSVIDKMEFFKNFLKEKFESQSA